MPQRTCVICRSTGAKRGLVRIVRTPANVVSIDATGKQAGRGAYLCADARCWHAAGLRARLGNALKTSITDDDYRGLEHFAAKLAPAGPSTTT